MSVDPLDATAFDLAAAISTGVLSATVAIDASLSRIEALNPRINAFTDVVADRARARAAAIDAKRARGEALGPLEGVPFAVKNLFDVAGLPTLAGSSINRDHPPASADATLIERLEGAGAVLVGALNMGEYYRARVRFHSFPVSIIWGHSPVRRKIWPCPTM